MFDVGMPELILIFLIALIVVGPEKLVEIAKAAGKGMGEFQRAIKEGVNSVEQEVNINELPVEKNNPQQLPLLFQEKTPEKK